MTTLVDAKQQECSRIQLRGLDWSAYQKISEALTGRHVRLTYDRGNLEFMTISSEHAFLCSLLGQMVVILTEELGLSRKSFADMTCDREELDRGLEPDGCFYLAHEFAVRGKRQIDFDVDPPPDLAIEIDLSPPLRDRLVIYAALGVPEVWRFDGRALVGLALDGDRYRSTEDSLSFPSLRIADLLPFLARRHATEEGALMREFRAWVRERLVPGAAD